MSRLATRCAAVLAGVVVFLTARAGDAPGPGSAAEAEVHLGRHWLARPHWVRSGTRGECYAMLPGADGGVRFILMEPARRMIWACALRLPLDVRERPLLQLAYEAGGMDPGGETMVFGLVAAAGPRLAVVPVMVRADLGLAGGTRTLVVDLTELELPGPVRGLAVHLLTRPAQMEPAWIELRSLAFRARGSQAATAALPGGMLTVTVRDAEGRPLQGALAVVDPERLDLAFCGETDAEGRAVLSTLGGGAALHTVRAEKQGYATVECAVAGAGETVVVLPAVRDGAGTVTTARGGGVPDAVVRASLPCIAVAGQVCLLPGETVAAAEGSWRLAAGVPLSHGSLGLLEVFAGERGRGACPVGLSGSPGPWSVLLRRVAETTHAELSTLELRGMAGDVAALTALSADPLEADAFRLEAARELLAIPARLPEARDDVLRGLLHAGARSREPLRGNLLGLYLAALRAAGLPPTAAVNTARRLGAAGVVPQDLLVALQSRGSFWQRLFAGEGARGAAAGTMVPVSPSPALAWPANAAALPAPVRVPEGPAREAAGACHAGPVPVPSPGSKSAPDPLDLTRLHGWLRAAPRWPVGNAVTVPEAARRPAFPVSPW